MRFLGVLKGTPESEAGTPPPPELFAKMADFMEEVTKAGVLLATDGLHPSSKAKKVITSGGKTTVVDGPFTEAKEVIASYGLFQVDSMDDAVYWTQRFLEVLGEGECHIYPIFEASDFGDALPPEIAAREEVMREQMARNTGS